MSKKFSFIFIGTLFFCLFFPKPVLAQTVEHFSPKVYYIIYNPTISSKNNIPLREYMHWNDPNVLRDQYIANMSEASYGIINYQVVGQIELNDIPQKWNGYHYTGDSLLACLQNTGPCNGSEDSDMANYNKILSDNNICTKVNNGEINELWLIGGPRYGFFESNMAGVGAYWTNGPIIQNTTCLRPLHIMGFSYEPDVTNMLHDFGHRFESTIDQFVGHQKNSTGYGWDDFRSNKLNYPGLTVFGCGDIHDPPNTGGSYVYWDTQVVSSTCDNWLTYPQMTTQTQNVSCSTWGCQEGAAYRFFMWWFKHIPHAPGTDSNGKKNNWWSYTMNLAKPFIPGDLDKNGKIDIFDYNILVQNFGNTTCGNVADIDGNCKVDIFDYNILVQNFGKSITSTSS